MKSFSSILPPRWRVPALLALFTLFFYWKVLFTNRVTFPWDIQDIFYPYLGFVHEELRHFRFPSWDPYAMSGFPIVGYIEAQIFYPINWLFLVVRPLYSLSYKLVEIQVILHFFLAGLFLFFLAREFVEDTLPALLGAVLFMSSGAMVAHTEHLAQISAMAWYPPIFLFARRGLLRGESGWTALAGLLFGVQILAGHWQHCAYLALFLFLYFFYEACFGPSRAQLWPRWCFHLLLIGAVGAALAMVQIVPTGELGFLSVRTQLTYWDVTEGNEPIYLWTLFLPNFLGGINGVPHWYPGEITMTYVFLTVPGLALALLGIVERLRRRDYFWLAAILLLIELSLGSNGYLAGLIYHTPILNLFRNPARYFDPANFALCLMAAVGAQSLFSKALWRPLQKFLPAVLFVVLTAAAVVGLWLRLAEKIPGWEHMLAVLAVFTALVAMHLAGRLRPAVSQCAILGLIVFELCFYNMNQMFNWSLNDPRRYMAADYALGRKESLQFLRSDPAGDFRVAAFAEYVWSGNGWNLWRIPGIYGWNPTALRRYVKYVRQFTQVSSYTLPYGGPDHNLDSPMLDLLGVKYVLVAGPEWEQELKLKQFPQFEQVFEDYGWWKIYRSNRFFSHAWFYPRAYVLPDESQALAVMNSSWFDPYRVLLFEEGDLSAPGAALAEPLQSLTLRADQFTAASSGRLVTDPYCADPVPMYGDWSTQGNWIRFAVPASTPPGRYRLLLEYTAGASDAPALEAELDSGALQQHSGPVVLPRTHEWPCHGTRTAELGEFDLAGGASTLTLTLAAPAPVNLFSLWLVRLPALPPEQAPEFSFDRFSIAANQISFNAHLEQEGFLLLNEIYYPGWEATVDGQPAEVLRADTIFRALFLPAGSHHIEFRFRPRYFLWGAACSALTLAAFLSYGFFRRRRTAPNKGPRLASQT